MSDPAESRNLERASYGLLFLLTALSRLPFLAAGFGADADAQRVVNVARRLRATGVYEASRLPGYPVQEYVVSWFVPGGAPVINGLSAACSGLCAVFFAMLLRATGVPRASAFALALGFAFVPVVYVNSTCALDYVWALAFVLAAAVLALQQRAWLAGLCLGFAIGTRITSGAMLLPLAALLLANTPATSRSLSSAWRASRGLLVAIPIAACLYAPVWARYGLKFFSYADPPGKDVAAEIALRATLEVWGAPGCVAILLGLVGVAVHGYRAPKAAGPASPRLWAAGACVSAIVLYVIAYLRLPHEAAYLIPIVPFTLWLIAIWTPRGLTWPLAALLCAAPFIGYHEGRLTLSGPVLADHAKRLDIHQAVERIIEAGDRLKRPSVIVAGYRLPAIEAARSSEAVGGPRYLYLIDSQAQFDQLRRDGYDVYFVDRGVEAYQARINGLRLGDQGVRRLKLPPKPRE